jgi:NADPH-dependent 2,4-dienoyl-CoA reductase/sulfur reductase-like enzyme
MNAPVVIVGTGLAGYNLAREFRKLDSETPLLLITADDGRSYSKPMLSTGFGKNKEADGLSMATPGRDGRATQGPSAHPYPHQRHRPRPQAIVDRRRGRALSRPDPGVGRANGAGAGRG